MLLMIQLPTSLRNPLNLHRMMLKCCWLLLCFTLIHRSSDWVYAETENNNNNRTTTTTATTSTTSTITTTSTQRVGPGNSNSVVHSPASHMHSQMSRDPVIDTAPSVVSYQGSVYTYANLVTLPRGRAFGLDPSVHQNQSFTQPTIKTKDTWDHLNIRPVYTQH